MSNYDLYSDFDVQKHKEKYPHYLEVLILEDGKVVYGVPSHQEKAIALACEKLNCTRQELSDMTPEEFYFDWLNWLLMQCKAISVWTEFVHYPEINQAQYDTLKMLKREGVYEGNLPHTYEIICH